jgi:membrane protease YdiL (CAAX protease family)
MNKDLPTQPWWSYLDEGQRELLTESALLLAKEREAKKRLHDYSFVVFPAAKAYEGFLKKLFYDTGLITKDDYQGERFRIGRALNPSLGQNHWAGSVYEHLKNYCGGEALPQGLWETWKKSRNLLFHYFLDQKRAINLAEAEERLGMIKKAIGAAVAVCQPAEEKKILETKRGESWRRIFWFYAFLLIVWGFYRFLFRLPASFEELVLKPIVWLGPLFWLVVYRERRPFFLSLGLVGKNIARSLYLGIGLGVLFSLSGLVLNFLKYGELNLLKISPADFWPGLLLSLATALVEETVFRGYILNRLFEILRDEWTALFISSLAFVLIHLPMTIFGLHYNLAQVYVYGVLVFFYSLGSGVLFLRTGTTWASVLMHLFWTWPIILFR